MHYVLIEECLHSRPGQRTLREIASGLSGDFFPRRALQKVIMDVIVREEVLDLTAQFRVTGTFAVEVDGPVGRSELASNVENDGKLWPWLRRHRFLSLCVISSDQCHPPQ